MKKFVFALICLLGTSSVSFADGITWGKKVVFPIKAVHYKGKVYSGALIASDVEGANTPGNDNTIKIFKPRVLVYGSNFGLDEVFELDSSSDEKGNSGTSPLCQNLGKKYTVMYDDQTPSGLVARFVSKDVVVIRESLWTAKLAIGCTDVNFDPN